VTGTSGLITSGWICDPETVNFTIVGRDVTSTVAADTLTAGAVEDLSLAAVVAPDGEIEGTVAADGLITGTVQDDAITAVVSSVSAIALIEEC